MRNRDDSALLAFVKRQTGLDHVRFLQDSADATRAVEVLKSWLARDGGVMWGNTNGCDWLRDLGAQVAWAQWRKLHPEADPRSRAGFDATVFEIAGGRDQRLDLLKSADWRAVSNALGHEIRGRCGCPVVSGASIANASRGAEAMAAGVWPFRNVASRDSSA